MQKKESSDSFIKKEKNNKKELKGTEKKVKNTKKNKISKEKSMTCQLYINVTPNKD